MMSTQGLRTVATLAFLFAFGSSLPSFAQDETPTKVTIQNRSGDLPFSTTIGTDIERVDVSSGNLIVTIPIVHVPGRGLDFDYHLRYDARNLAVVTRYDPTGRMYDLWNITGDTHNNTPSYLSGGGNPGLGWWPGGSMITFGTKLINCTEYDQSTYKLFYLYRDGNGVRRSAVYQFANGNPALCGGIWDSSGPVLSAEGFLAKNSIIVSNPIILAPDGTTINTNTSWGITLKDPNGNQRGDGPGATDTLGRVSLTQQNGTNQILYRAWDSNGIQQTYTVNFANVSLHTAFNLSGPNGAYLEYQGTRSAISSIVLPSGRSYQFQYENGTYGAITRIDLPTGAYITYNWSTHVNAYKTIRYVSSRTVNVNGQAYTWNFNLSGTGNVLTMTVTDPLGNQSVYVSAHGNVTQAKIYQGAASGTPLRQFDISYFCDSDPTEFQHDGDLQYEVRTPVACRPTRITTTLENGLTTKKEFDYDSITYTYHPYLTPIGQGPPDMSAVESFTTSRGNVTEIREFGFGTDPNNLPLLRRTKNAYLHDSNSAYLDANIVSKIVTQTICDGVVACNGTGDQAAQTQYEYDQYLGDNPLTPTTNAPQHDYTNFSTNFTTRGNVTRVKHWRNTDGALLTTTYTYDDLGNILAIKDPQYHTTSYSYNDSWANSSCPPPSNTQAFVTQITNALNQHVQFKYWPCTGLRQTRKDENDILAGRAGVTSTYDLMGRLTQQNSPDGGQSTNSYNDTPPVSVTSTTKITSALNLVRTSVMDGLGRETQSRLTSDPQGTVYVDTTYDGLGRTATVSNPYRSTAEATYGITTTEYDALGRVTKLIPPDGTTSSNNVTTVYAGNSTTVTDQAGRMRRSFADALGRLIQVDEPTSAGPGTPTPGVGWVDITGAEQSFSNGQWEYQCVLWDEFGGCVSWEWVWVGETYWDYGGVSITVNGFTKSASYAEGSTGSSIAWSLANAFNSDPASPVTASANGIRVSLTSKTSGANTNYSLSATSWTNDPAHFGPSFVPATSGATLTGGSDSGGGSQGTLNPPAVTLYTYDILGNLTCVVQKGTDTTPFTNCASAPATWRPRSFTYNSLSQLLQVVNPESGTINYIYDDDGNLATKIAPKSNQTGTLTVTTTYAYDQVHRLTQKSYSDGTPTAKYGYDGVAPSGCTPPSLTIFNGVGKRTSMCDAAGAEAWSYEITTGVGWKTTDKRTTNNFTKTFVAQSNFGGSTATLAYPSGRTITYTPNAAGHAVSAVDSVGPINYATSASYTAGGALSSLMNGASIVSTFYYNNRLQPCRISVKSTGTAPVNCGDTTNVGNVLDFSYAFAAGIANNGNVVSVANNRVPNRTQNFSYDELNRLASAQTTSNLWGNTYVYDTWANLLQKNQMSGKTEGEYLQQTVNAKNQIAGFCYDSAGNLLFETVCPQPLGTLTYNYDAENRMTQSVISGLTTNYVYDGDGKRVKRDQTNGSAHRLYWYGLGSDPLEESNLSGTASADFIYFNGKRVARRDLPGGAVHYFFSDHLGSASVVTNAGGTTNEEESDYYPWGRERVIADMLPDQNYKFTGKERDTESGLDFFGARYYSSQYGRFISADLPFADQDPADPQSWNLYSYVRNNPMRHVDPDGEGAWDVIKGVAEGAKNFVANTVKGAAYTAYALSPLGQLTGADRELVADVAEGVKTAVKAYKDDGVSGTADKVLAQGEQGAAAIVTEAVLDGGLTATIRVKSVKPTTGDAGAAESGISRSGTSGRASEPAAPADSVPATGPGRPTAAQQRAVNEIGSRTGCHSCGAKSPGTKSGNWIADHQPSTALNPPGGQQVLKPQCLTCSRRQGGVVAAAVKQAKKHKDTEGQ